MVAYQLLDSGGSRRLEEWSGLGFSLALWAGPNGQLGAFPEQHSNWAWLHAACLASPSPLRVLNLFGYTGGSTLACAASGQAELTHLDGSRAAVARARSNADRSSLSAAPIKWIAEDATTYVSRAVRRGERFDGVILDPPAFGRGGAKKKEWRIERDLPPLLDSLRLLLGEEPAFVLLSSHDPRWAPSRLEQSIRALDFVDGKITSGTMRLHATSGKHLDMGGYCRYISSRLDTT
ncbi:MAG: hypothetical protein SGPRY_007062 [Prymnesium sp.]